MGTTRNCLVTLLIVALLASGSFASGFENSGFGAKGRGMSGAFRAIASDWTAAYYNPAGYAYILDNEIGGTIGFLHLRNELTPNVRWRNTSTGDSYETGFVNDRTMYNAHEIQSNPSGGFVTRLPLGNGEIGIGLSAYQPFDYNITWRLFEPLRVYNDQIVLPTNQFTNDIDVVAFQLTVGREFSEKLAIGLGLQLLRADLYFTDIILRDNPMVQLDPDSPLSDRPFEKILQRSLNDANGFGFGIRGGAMYKASEKLNVGIVAALPFDITVKGEAHQEYYLPNIPNIDSGAIIPGSIGGLFTAGSTVRVASSVEAKISLPASLSFGLAYTASEKLTVAFDAEYTFWSQYKGLEFVGSNHSGLFGPADTVALAREFFTSNNSSPVEWDNTGKMMLGISYQKNDYVTLLAGAGIDQALGGNGQLRTPHLVDTGTKYSFSGGFLVGLDRWDFGLTTEYTSLPDVSVGSMKFNDDGTLANLPGVYGGGSYQTVMSISHRF